MDYSWSFIISWNVSRDQYDAKHAGRETANREGNRYKYVWTAGEVIERITDVNVASVNRRRGESGFEPWPGKETLPLYSPHASLHPGEKNGYWRTFIKKGVGGFLQ